MNYMLFNKNKKKQTYQLVVWLICVIVGWLIGFSCTKSFVFLCALSFAKTMHELCIKYIFTLCVLCVVWSFIYQSVLLDKTIPKRLRVICFLLNVFRFLVFLFLARGYRNKINIIFKECFLFFNVIIIVWVEDYGGGV